MGNVFMRKTNDVFLKAKEICKKNVFKKRNRFFSS